MWNYGTQDLVHLISRGWLGYDSPTLGDAADDEGSGGDKLSDALMRSGVFSPGHRNGICGLFLLKGLD